MRVAAEGLSVRQVEDLVRSYADHPASTAGRNARLAPAAVGESDPGMAEVEEILSEQLATRVQGLMGPPKGKIVLEFGSREDLDRIVSEIVGCGPGMAPE